MTRYSKYNVVYRLQKWMDSVPGQTFLNYAYSWGASIVVLGALFKLTHLPGADFMLFIGMGTEVFVFFISAFDRPFDKTTDGMELPVHVGDEEDNDEEPVVTASAPAAANVRPVAGNANVSHGNGGPTYINVVPAGAGLSGSGVSGGGASVEGGVSGSGMSGTGLSGGAPVSSSEAGAGIVTPSSQENTEELNEAQTNYVTALKTLTETIGKVQEQCEHLTSNSDEMKNLNRTLTGISTVYEMQLKGASKQIGTIDQINDQTRRMAEQIEQLNRIYARMIEAMTVNMRAQTPGAAPQI
jgi:hypothetical protein